MSNKIDDEMTERMTLEISLGMLFQFHDVNPNSTIALSRGMALEEAKSYLAEAGRKVEAGDYSMLPGLE